MNKGKLCFKQFSYYEDLRDWFGSLDSSIRVISIETINESPARLRAWYVEEASVVVRGGVSIDINE